MRPSSTHALAGRPFAVARSLVAFRAPAGSRSRGIRLALASALLFALAARPAGATTVDYLYVESNEGGSSGGHVALRIGEHVFDYQHYPGGFLRLERRRAGDFLYSYAWLQNRPVHVQRLGLDDAGANAMRERFDGLFLSEAASFEALGVVREDARLLAARHRREPVSVEVPGAGYFVRSAKGPGAGDPGPPASAVHEGRSPVLAEARATVEERYGKGWIEARRDEARAALEAVEPSVVDARDLPVGPQAWPRTTGAWSRRLREGLALVVALDVLDESSEALPGALLEDASAAPGLTDGEIAAFGSLRLALLERVVALASSRRADRGEAMLTALVRLVAVDRSLATRRLVVPDLFPADPPVLRLDAVLAAGVLADLRSDATADLDEARAVLLERVAGGHDGVERAWSRVEAAAARRHELTSGVAEGRDLRLLVDDTTPSRAAPIALPPCAPREPGRLGELAASAETRADQYEASLRSRLAYDLVGRNCVSELLGAMTAGDEPGDEPGDANRREAGAPGEASASRGSGAVVPFASTRAVAERFPVRGEYVVASYREQRLASLRSQGVPPRERLREASTLTSTIYRRNDDDSYFVLFADLPLLRPFGGVVNLAAGALATVAGGLSAPWTGPQPLLAGLRGMAFSVPELAFVGIRKGTFVYVPRAQATEPAWW